MTTYNNQQNYSDEIAVIGIGCRFPGGIVDLPTFWDFLCNKQEAVSKIPSARWNWRLFYDHDNTRVAKSFFLNGSFLTQPVDEFEPLFFGMSPKEANYCDPQQRLLLEIAWQAMEEGGLVPAKYVGQKVGVFVGIFSTDWLIMQANPYSSEGDVDNNFLATAAPTTMLAARLSYVFDFCGPCLVMDTACSSSLTAIHLACQSLKSGDSDMALAGGVNLMLAPHSGGIVAKAHFMAEDGRSKSFDAAADGYGRGEGCGVVVLKRLKDALRDGNKIHAVISGSGINQDGHNEGLVVPNTHSQEKLMRAVAEQAQVNLKDIVYVEAHGTGTPVGDPLETQAISKAIGRSRAEGNPVIIGSVKSNIGHLEAAAGVAGLIKACLCLEHKAVPPQGNLNEPNPNIPFKEWNLRLVQDETVPLIAEADDLYVGVNSFGYGGSNANALLRAVRPDEKAIQILPENVTLPSDYYLLTLSTRQQASLKLTAESYIELLNQLQGPSLADICYSVGVHRSSFQRRLAVFGKTKEEIAQKLGDFVQDRPNSDIILEQQVIKPVSKSVFVFSGMGPQWWGMGQWLLQNGPSEFREIAEKCDQYFKQLSGWSILKEMQKSEEESCIYKTEIAQPALFIIQVGLVELLKLYDVAPSAIIGHSVGEIAAAYVAGVLELSDAIKVVYYRSHLQQRFADQGTMLAVGMPPSTVSELIGGYEEDVAVAAINSPRSFTLSGTKTNLEKIAAQLQEKGEFYRFLKVEVPYHNPVMAALKEEFEEALADIRPKLAKIPFYSSVTGQLCDDTFLHDADYWYRNLRQTVLFAEAITTMLHDSHRLFTEISPHPVLSSSIRECAAAINTPIGITYTLHRSEPEEKAIIKLLAVLSVTGFSLNWEKLTGGCYVDLPFYRWARESYWTESKRSIDSRLREPIHPVLGNIDWAGSRGWLAETNPNIMPWLVDHKIEGMVVFPAAAYVEAALAAHAELAINAPQEMRAPAIIEDLQIKKALIIEGKFYPYITWSVDELTNRLLAYVRTENDSHEWEFHGSVFLRYSAPWGGDKVEDVETLKTRINQEIDPAFYYQRLGERGLEYGPAFQTIRTLFHNENEALAYLSVIESEKDEIEKYFLHPTLLDGAFQLFGILCAGEQIADKSFLPIGIKRIMYYGKHETALYAHACNIKHNEDIFEGDIYLYSEKGEPVAKVTGLTVKEVATQKQREARRAKWLYQYEWKESEVPPLLAEIARIAIITDQGTDCNTLISELKTQGISICQATIGNDFHKDSEDSYYIRSNCVEDYQAFFSAVNVKTCRAIVYLRQSSLENEPVDLTCVEDMLTLVNGLPLISEVEVQDNFRLIVITNGVEVIDKSDQGTLQQSTLRGFVRALTLERPELRVKMIDVDADFSLTESRVLSAEILVNDSEDDVTLRRDKRFVGRLSHYKLQESTTLVPFEDAGENLGFRLVSPAPGMLDKLRYEAFVRQPVPPGHVELEVVAASLNFKDLLKVMGVLPRNVTEGTYHGSHYLGMEATVRVLALGEGAENKGLVVGDLLTASFHECFRSHAIVNVEDFYGTHIEKKAIIREAHRYNIDTKLVENHPRDKVPEQEACAAPTVFGTAYYSLCNLANVQKGEIVLIHAAAGGLGLACIEIAKFRGARIFATAGTEEKREYLRQIGCEHVWNSRNLEFVDGVKQVTKGRGVDVVINSLSGEALHHSLALLASFGRFIEVGKRDIAEEKWLPMLSFNKNIAFFSMDLDRMLAEKPELVVKTFSEVTLQVIEGNINFPHYTVFPAAKIVDAFRSLASAQHIGKIVVDFADKSDVMVKPVPKLSAFIREDSTYLITGAYGGIGLKLAEWLVSQGAKYLALIGRSLKEEDVVTQSVLKRLEEKGTEILQIKADVTNYADLEKALGTIEKKMPILRGVFHCAAVIDDGVLENLNSERIARVILPKAQGAWILHKLTQNIPLDHFVLFSSVTSLIGNIGQASYVAANFFLDALARFRKQQGLPALSISWGAIQGGNMLQKDTSAAKNFELSGVKSIPVDEALKAISLLWKENQTCLAIMDMDWSKWFSVLQKNRSVARFEALVSLIEGSYEQTEVLQRLNSLPVEERLPFVVENLIGILAKTLQIPQDSIDGTTRLTELGIDSLVGVELQIAISNNLGCDVSLLQLMKEENLQDVGKVLLRKLKIPFQNTESLVVIGSNHSGEDQSMHFKDALEVEQFSSENDTDMEYK